MEKMRVENIDPLVPMMHGGHDHHNFFKFDKWDGYFFIGFVLLLLVVGGIQWGIHEAQEAGLLPKPDDCACPH